jgi:hypothetical protein
VLERAIELPSTMIAVPEGASEKLVPSMEVLDAGKSVSLLGRRTPVWPGAREKGAILVAEGGIKVGVPSTLIVWPGSMV